MIALLRTEWAKTLRRPRTYVALGLVVALPIVIVIALWAQPARPRRRPAFFSAATQTGLLFPASMLNLMSRFLLVVVVGLFAGDAIAGEANTGQPALPARAADRARPAPRREARRSRSVLASSATMLLTVTATLAGGLAFGFEPVDFQFFFDDQSVGNLFIHIGHVDRIRRVVARRHRGVRLHGLDDDRLARPPPRERPSASA